MASFTIIRDVSATLKTLIQDKISELTASDAVKFESPAELTAGSSPQLSVFLYKVRHNSFLRNVPPVPLSATEMGYTPLSLDLLYLFTPFSNNIETEFVIVEKLMQAFHDTSELSGALLQGNLVEDGNTELRLVPDDLNLDEMNKLWTAFPGKAYRLGVSYQVTPVRIPSSRTQTMDRVITREIQYSIGGQS